MFSFSLHRYHAPVLQGSEEYLAGQERGKETVDGPVYLAGSLLGTESTFQQERESRIGNREGDVSGLKTVGELSQFLAKYTFGHGTGQVVEHHGSRQATQELGFEGLAYRREHGTSRGFL